MALIAIVDDSRLARTFSSAALKKGGHEPLEIDPVSVEAVLSVLRDRQPGLLLLDYLMPGCPGAEVVRACHADPGLNALKIIMVTAHHETEDQAPLGDLGVQMILHKPVDPRLLSAAVAKLLDAAE